MIEEKKLLPAGFYDLIFDEAEKNHKNINKILDNFFNNNFRLIKLPLVEFAHNFSRHELENSFRTTDVISGKNLAFRTDITLQLSRVLSSRLNKEKLPIKICYSGDVLFLQNPEKFNRQETQVGIEIIGSNKEKSYFEIIENLLNSLKKIATKNLLIEFSIPEFLEIYLQELGLKSGDEKYQKIKEAILNKDISEIKKSLKDKANLTSQIILLNNNLENLSKEILKDFKSKEVADILQKAQKISNFLKKNYQEIDVRFDIFGDDKSNYHNEISFNIYSKENFHPIAKGGGYKINKTEAVGATIYVNQL